MKCIVVRHGETDANKRKIIMGQRHDESLNEEGRRQGQSLLPQLIDKGFAVILSSPLKRARETAEIIGLHLGIPTTLCDDLKERDYGSLSGKTWEDIERIKREATDLRTADLQQQYDYCLYGGESVEDVKIRIHRFIRETKKSRAEEKIIVVTHGGILRLFHNLYGQKVLTEIGNASIHEFDL